MIRLAQRASLLVAFSLLTSAATAHAACEWVFWQQIEEVYHRAPDGNRTEWRIRAAAESKAECSNELRAALQPWQEGGRPERANGEARQERIHEVCRIEPKRGVGYFTQ
jgi:hypothetical protein